MHFYEGPEHEHHQDQYYLPDCMSAWIAMTNVDKKKWGFAGTTWIS